MPGWKAIPPTAQTEIAKIMKEANVVFTSYVIGQYASCALQRATKMHESISIEIRAYALVHPLRKAFLTHLLPWFRTPMLKDVITLKSINAVNVSA